MSPSFLNNRVSSMCAIQFLCVYHFPMVSLTVSTHEDIENHLSCLYLLRLALWLKKTMIYSGENPWVAEKNVRIYYRCLSS